MSSHYIYNSMMTLKSKLNVINVITNLSPATVGRIPYPAYIVWHSRVLEKGMECEKGCFQNCVGLKRDYSFNVIISSLATCECCEQHATHKSIPIGVG